MECTRRRFSSIWLQASQSSAHTLTSLIVLQLSELNISNNLLTGTLPSSWGSLEQVSMLCTLLLHVHFLITCRPLALVLLPNSLGSCSGGVDSLPYSMSGDWLMERPAPLHPNLFCLALSKLLLVDYLVRLQRIVILCNLTFVVCRHSHAVSHTHASLT